MNFTLQLEYPLYFIAICFVAGGAYAGLMYYKAYFGERVQFWAFPNWLLALLRFLAVSVITFLLLGPFVKSYFQEVKKPVVAVALDNSASVTVNRDSAFYRDSFPGRVRQLTNVLEDQYEVQTFVFGQDVQSGQALTYQAEETNLAKPIEGIYDRYYNRNLGAVVLATDGIYNQGRSPLAAAEKLQAPIYPVALGDTIPNRDWRISKVRHNDIVYAGNEFPVEVRIKAEALNNQNQTLTLEQEGETVFQEQFRSTSQSYDTTIRTLLSIDDPGLKTFKASLTPRKAEINTVNNHKAFYIEALESKKQIALIAKHAHPDLAAIARALRSKKRYEVNTFTLDQWQQANEAISSYNVVFFHQLPGSRALGQKLVRKAQQEAIPSFYLIGTGTDLKALQRLKAGIQVQQQQGNQSNQVRPALQQRFSAFTLSNDCKRLLKKLPPVKAPFGKYSFNAPHSTLLRQQIGEVTSDKPLLAFIQQPNYKIGVLTATDLWRWYLSEYRIRGEHKAIPELLTKAVQYLSVETEKRQFQLVDQQNRYQQNERITVEAEFYNESYEPVQDAKLSMAVTNQAGKTYDFNFKPMNEGYQLEAGYLPPGRYDFRAEARYGGDVFTREGAFVVESTNKELLATVADHTLLNNLASAKGGEVVYPRKLSALPQKLQAAGDLKNIAEEKYRLQELIHSKPLFFIILLFLGGEWFLRKYYGGY